MKENQIKIFIAIISIVLGSVLTWFLKGVQDKTDGAMRYLDFQYEIKNNIIGHPDGLNKKIDVLLDGQKIENLSQVAIKIYNGTDRDYENLPVHIEIYSSKGDSLKLLQADVYGQEESTDFVEIIPETLPPQRKGGIKLAYKIKNLNRIGDNPVFTSNILLVGTCDKFQINVFEKGLDLQDYKSEHFNKPKFWQREEFIITSFLLFYIAFFVWLIKHGARKEKKANEEFTKYLEENLQRLILEEKISLNSEQITREVIKLKKLFAWSRTRKWIRFIEGKTNPSEEN